MLRCTRLMVLSSQNVFKKISKRSSLRTEIRVQLNLDPSSVQPQEAGIDFDEFW